MKAFEYTLKTKIATFVLLITIFLLLAACNDSRFIPIEVPANVPEFDCARIGMDDCRWMAFRAEDGTIVVPLVAETDSTVSRITYKEQSLEGDLRFSNLGVTSGWHSNMERSRAFAGKGIESDVLHAGDETLKSQVGGGAIRVFETNGRWGAEVIADIANILFTDSGIWVYQLN